MVITIISLSVILLISITIFMVGYFKAPPDKAYIVSGIKKEPRVYIGRAGFKFPFLERLDKINLGAIQIDVKTRNPIPTKDYININIDATASVKISQRSELLKIATQNYLNQDIEAIAKEVNDLLEGNLREIVGTISLAEMVGDREALSQKVQTNTVPDLQRLGLEIINFNIQDFTDTNDVIVNLGVDNVEQIRKGAQISRAEAEKEIAIAQAKAAKEANDAKVQAQEAIAERNAQLEAKQAELKKTVDTQKAQADAAKLIESENQRKLRDIAATDADIAKAERQADLRQKEIALKEYELTAVVRKKAEADKYAAEQEAEAQKAVQNRAAEAKAYTLKQAAEAMAYETEQKANAAKLQADADRYVAEQRAAGIAAIGAAEAEAILKKAEAQKAMGEASVLEMYLAALPKIVEGAAAPLYNVDKIIQYGDGNSTKMVKDVMGVANQVIEAMGENGIDLKALLSGALGGKIASNNN